ncbi:putative baseplate assembly protein [Microbacterium ureisolvens]|uniref:putative baseplate assembly protein n=1 Tax=Microbacterium ureisolvens TaxID=2781186 RepID=UPI00362B8085
MSTTTPSGHPPLDPTIRGLSVCGCCAGGMQAPQLLHNRPGLSAIRYRIGTHGRFKATMLARLTSADLPALADLGTRSDDDFSIALLDAWAATADILTFYQERIANECFLRTATERRSLSELATLIGYLPRPGVAANVHLAFTLDDAGTPGDIPVPIGTRVQSIPGPGETPQTFETVEAIAGRAEWNAMRPLERQLHPDLTKDTERVTLRGTATNLRKGDSLLLLVGAGTADRIVKRVLNVTPDPVAQATRIDLAEDPPDPPPLFVHLPLAIWSPLPATLSTASVASTVLAGSWKQADLIAYAAVQKWPLTKLSTTLTNLAARALRAVPREKGVFALRQRASVFGHNAPRYDGLPANYVTGADGKRTAIDPLPYGTNWDDQTLDKEPGAANAGSAIDLDQAYPEIVAGSWLVLETPTSRDVYRVQDTAETSRADYTLSSRVSRVTLDSNQSLGNYPLRTTAVLAQSEQLELAEIPIPDAVAGNRVVLERAFLGLAAGRAVVVSGIRTDLEGVEDSEIMVLADVRFSGGHTELTFVNDLAHEYRRDSVTVNANVALATHGETREQALGSGDGTRSFQAFTLPEAPLTHVSADNALGTASTLQVRVNELLWQEVPWFHGHGPDEHVYVTRTDDEGRTTVRFGDGRSGARLPTGTPDGGENVRVSYRKGIGPAGLVAEGQLSLLVTRPLGVRSVTNPVPAADAAAPERVEDIRRNAALPIRTLDRIVSLRDYEDFARAFAGVAKALATWTWTGPHRGVFLTVAGEDGAAIEPGGVTYANLLNAIRAAGDPEVPIHVASYRPAFFRLSGGLTIDPARREDAVVAAVEAALRDHFSFRGRRFGEPLAKSEVIAAIQRVRGVVAVELDELHRVDASQAELAKTRVVDTLISAAPGPVAGGATLPAELLLLDPRPVPFRIVRS